MPYSFKDIKVSINGSGIYCSQAELQNTAQYVPAYNVASPMSNNYVGSRDVEGTLSLSYFLTGADPLADFLNKTIPFGVNMGGLKINSGYVDAYKLSANLTEPASAEVSIKFYEDIEGTLGSAGFMSFMSEALGEPVPNDLLDKVVPLAVSDATIEGGISVKQGEALSLSYSYSCEVEPAYVIGKRIPSNIIFGVEKAEAQVSLYSYDMSLLTTGIRENFKINFNDKNGNTQQSFVVNSHIGQKSLTSSAGGGRNHVTLNMGQTNLGTLDGEEPLITSMVPDSGDTGDDVKLQGNNFLSVEKIFLGQYPCKISGYSSTEAVFYVPREVFSGYKAPVYLVSNGEKFSSPTGFLVTGGGTF